MVKETRQHKEQGRDWRRQGRGVDKIWKGGGWGGGGRQYRGGKEPSANYDWGIFKYFLSKNISKILFKIDDYLNWCQSSNWIVKLLWFTNLILVHNSYGNGNGTEIIIRVLLLLLSTIFGRFWLELSSCCTSHLHHYHVLVLLVLLGETASFCRICRTDLSSLKVEFTGKTGYSRISVALKMIKA